MKKRSPRRIRRPGARTPDQALVDETIALFRWLSWVSDQIYGDDARGATRRWIVRTIHRQGPRTVPALARARTMRRQGIQPLVNALVREGVIALERTPEHRRSRLVVLTARGEEIAAKMDRIDARVLRTVTRGIADANLAHAAETLRRLRAGFERERWS